MNLSALRNSASIVLAASVFESFPNVKLLDGGVTHTGFYYDFIFPHSIHPELHLQIEEKMRGIVRERREIRILEMVAISAREFLKSKGHLEKAKKVDGMGLFQLVEMGHFIDLSDGEHVKNSAQIQNFKLFEPESFGDGVMRISGTAFETKEELKAFFKKWHVYSKKRHEKVGFNRNYWKEFEGDLVWLPAGLKAEADLISVLKENLYPGALEIRIANPKTAELLSFLNAEVIFEINSVTGDASLEDVGLFESAEGKEIQITISLKNVISSLQFIVKTLNILNFRYSIRFSPSKRQQKGSRLLEVALKDLGWEFEVGSEQEIPGVEFLVPDGLGRLWEAVRLEAQGCLFARLRVERILALVLEM